MPTERDPVFFKRNPTIPTQVDGIEEAEPGEVVPVEHGGTGADTAAGARTNLDLDPGDIKTYYESNPDTNAFTDAEKTKLGTVESGATADQTGAEIKSLYEAEPDTNAFTDAEKTKLAGIESGAQVNDVFSVFGRTGAIVAQASDYDADQIDYDNTGSGLLANEVQAAIDELAAELVEEAKFDAKGDLLVGTGDDTFDRQAVGANDQALVADSVQATGVKWAAIVNSFNGRTGAVVPAASDYDASQVDNDSGVAGATVAAALDTLDGDITTLDGEVVKKAVVDAKGDLLVGTAADTVARKAVGADGRALVADSAQADGLDWETIANSVFGRTGAVTAQAGDYTAAQVTSTPTGDIAATDVQAAIAELETEKTAKATLTTKGDIYARSATAVVRLAVGTNNRALVANSATSTGLQWQLIVNSFNGRTGAVVPASGDYTAAQVTNTSTVSGATVQAALDTLNTGKIDEADFGAKGQLLVGTGAGTHLSLGVGTDGRVLAAASAETSGVKWAQDLSQLGDDFTVLDLGTLPNSTTKLVAHGLTIDDTEMLFMYGSGRIGASTMQIPLPFTQLSPLWMITISRAGANISITTNFDASSTTGKLFIAKK